MLVYRITNSKRSSDITGTGAALYPGRWNIKGTPVLYTGESKEIALLENLVHIPPLLTPDLTILTIDIPNHLITTLNVNDLPSNWFHYPAPTILSEIGQKWVDECKYLALKVPSCIIHTSFNVILNCSFNDYSKYTKVISEKAFHFDSRLIK